MSCDLRPVRGFLLFRTFHLAKAFCQVWLRLYVARLGSVAFLVKAARNGPRHPDGGTFEAR